MRANSAGEYDSWKPHLQGEDVGVGDEPVAHPQVRCHAACFRAGAG